ncbi:MAG: hypothetical protein ACI4R9_01515 [Kiritimatiellia bacterium]
MNRQLLVLALSAFAICVFAQAQGESSGRGGSRERGKMQANPEMKLHRFSTTIEKERPELN